MDQSDKKKNQFKDNPLAQAILREGLLIQDRFSSKPVYAKTGKGHLKSSGVSEVASSKKAKIRKHK